MYALLIDPYRAVFQTMDYLLSRLRAPIMSGTRSTRTLRRHAHLRDFSRHTEQPCGMQTVALGNSPFPVSIPLTWRSMPTHWESVKHFYAFF